MMNKTMKNVNKYVSLVTAATLLAILFFPVNVSAQEQIPEEIYEDFLPQENYNDNIERTQTMDEKNRLDSLPKVPDRYVSAEDLFKYYRMNGKEVGIYDLRPDRIYYMYYMPTSFSIFYKHDYFVVIDKVWEQKRGGLIGMLGNFTKRTVQYTDVETGEVNYNRPLTYEVRFFELEKIERVSDPSISNQFR